MIPNNVRFSEMKNSKLKDKKRKKKKEKRSKTADLQARVALTKHDYLTGQDSLVKQSDREILSEVQSEPTQQTKSRDYSIDILRGSAIIFMIITHVNALFLQGKPQPLDTLTFWGATVCFTIFLFCFGYVYGNKISQNKFHPMLALIKALQILLAYYVSAYAAQIFLNKGITIDQTLKILTFQILPEYTEFILAFVIYLLLMSVTWRVLKKLLDHTLLFVILGFTVYFLANTLYKIDLGNNYFTDIKSLLVGNLDWHRFGILSYFPIFVLGLVWGKISISQVFTTKKRLYIVLSALTFSITLFYLFDRLPSIGEPITTWLRWPPSLKFFTYGTIYISLVLALSPIINKLSLVNKIFYFLSKHSLAYFVLNVFVIIGGASAMNFNKFDQNSTIIVNIVAFVLITSFILLKEEVKVIKLNP